MQGEFYRRAVIPSRIVKTKAGATRFRDAVAAIAASHPYDDSLR